MRPNMLQTAVAGIGICLLVLGCASSQTKTRIGDTVSGRVTIRQPHNSPPRNPPVEQAADATIRFAVPGSERLADSTPSAGTEHTQDPIALSGGDRVHLANAYQASLGLQQSAEFSERMLAGSMPAGGILAGLRWTRLGGYEGELSSPVESDDGNTAPATSPEGAELLEKLNLMDGDELPPAAPDDADAGPEIEGHDGSEIVPIPPNRTGDGKGTESEGGGEHGAMHLNDMDVRKVLEILSREHNLNILISPGVRGTVTANLSGLTLEQTFDAILKSCKLIAQRENGVIYVYSQKELGLTRGGDKDDKVGIRVFRLNYIKGADLEKMIKPFLSPLGKMTFSPASQTGIRQLMSPSTGGALGGAGGSGGGGGGGGGGGAGQSVTGGDSLASGEAVVIQDLESNLASLDEIIAKLDAQPQQVLIEAIIISATLNKDCELGVNFGVVDNPAKVLSLIGSGAAINSAVGFLPEQVLQAGTGLVTQGFATDEHGIKFGFTGRNVTAFIRALDAVGNIEVLATPRILVLNKQPAELLLGNRLGYTTASQSLVSTVQNVQFMNVGTLLRVRPFISTDGMVRMEIHPERSSGSVVNNIPQMSTSEVTTNVLVPNGSTIVIGGLMDNEDNRQHFGVPVLGRLPLIGALFRERTQNVTKKELIVLLTVQIWNPAGAAPLEQVDRAAAELPAP